MNSANDQLNVDSYQKDAPAIQFNPHKLFESLMVLDNAGLFNLLRLQKLKITEIDKLKNQGIHGKAFERERGWAEVVSRLCEVALSKRSH